MKHSRKIILASSSPYRRALLERLGLEFDIEIPEVDETPLADEPADELVLRLSCEKAQKMGGKQINALVIGSDQVACLDQQILTKPGNRENAIKQLQAMSGKNITFLTGLCLYNTSSKQSLSAVIPFIVHFRDYDIEEIQRYLDIDTPYDCAGSFKYEKMGICLVSKMEGEDPWALMGLPLIKLTEMLRSEGIKLP